ncbi:MAG: hypothetical protein QXQ29_03500 [Candidatus Bathyarchaeia archaeon]
MEYWWGLEILSGLGNKSRKLILLVYLLVSIVILLFSTFFLLQAIQAYNLYQYERGFSLLFTGIIGLALSLYMLSVYMRRPGLIRRREVKRMIAVLECVSCSYRDKRDYVSGDYIMKESGECPVCGGKTLVTEIYPEVIGRG